MTAPRSPEPEGLALWSFLWGAGCRRLHLAARGVPARGDLVVSSLAELLLAVDDAHRGREARAGLAFQLGAGFLERWLRDGLLQPAAAQAARAIRLDDRALKAERWLQRVGHATYVIGAHRIASVHDLASLPERGGDLAALWEHLREGVPQARFQDDPATVRVLDEVRDAAEIPELDRPLIACLRLGLRRLPWADRFLASLDDLEPAILEPGGREVLHGLLASRVLETWVEAIAPGQGALVAAARGLDPVIAADRAVRSVLGPAAYPIPRVRARDFAELGQQAGALFHALCGDPAARARIRDAICGPIRLPGAPPDPEDPPERELAKIPAEHRPNVFAWHLLRLPILHLGSTVVRSLEEYLAAIAEPAGRAAAIALAADGMISHWYRSALGGALSEALQGKISEDDFPALCIEMGEPPPRVEASWSRAIAAIPEGGSARFEATLANRDPVRAAVLALSRELTPPRGRLAIEPRLVLPPGASATVQLEYQSPPGTAGQTAVAVAISHAGPREVPIARTRLLVIAGFPWRTVLPIVGAWAGLAGVALLLVRLALEPLADAVLYRAGVFRPSEPSGALAASVGLAPAVLGFVLAHVAIAIRHRRFWPPTPDGARLRLGRWLTSALGGLAVVSGAARGFDVSVLLGIAAVGLLLIKLAERDLTGALLFGAWLVLGKDVGELILWALGGLDALAIMTAGAFGISGAADRMAIWGWWCCGALLGVAFGTAVALRSIHRALEAEAARAVILALAALLIGALGAPGAP